MMNERLRNRLIGAVALVCLLIIFIPLLNAPSEDEERMPPLPLPPSLQMSTEPEAVSTNRRQQEISARFAEWGDGSRAPSDECRVRVGVFARPETIVQRLRDDKHEVALQPWREDGEGPPLFAVYAGGTMRCGEAERLRDALQSRYGVRPLVEYNRETSR